MPTCQNCGQNNGSYTPLYNSNCDTPPGCTPTDSTCVIYTGPTLACLDIESNTDIEKIFISLDEKVCDLTGAVFLPITISCLNGGNPIASLQDFVNILGTDYCIFKGDFTTFQIATNLSITNINTAIAGIQNPNIASCSYVGITTSDNIKTVDTKQNSAICSLWNYINLAGIDWGTGAPTISNVNNAFQYVLSLIEDSNELPTFNNVGSCLVNAVTATDTLVSTIANIKATICDIYSQIEIPTITAQCITPPTSISSLATFAYNNISTLWEQRVTYDSNYFTLSPGDTTCDPKLLTLNSAYLGKVKVNEDDSLAYLEDKLIPGTGIDIVTSAGKVVISATSTSGLTSVGAGFNNGAAVTVTNSPLIANGSLIFHWTGTSDQYVRGDGTLSSFPTFNNTNIGNANQDIVDPIRVVSLNNNTLQFQTDNSNYLRMTGNPALSNNPSISMVSSGGISLSNASFFSTFNGLGLVFSTISTTPAILKTDNLTGASARTHQLPDANGTYVLKVNGISADNTGNVLLDNVSNTNIGNTNLTIPAGEARTLTIPSGVGSFKIIGASTFSIGAGGGDPHLRMFTPSSILFSTTSSTFTNRSVLKTTNVTGEKTNELPNDNGVFTISVNGQYADNNGAITIPGDIEDNGYEYGSTVSEYKGFDTKGGIATGATRYITTSSAITINPEDHFLVLELNIGASIALPDPEDFPNRILHFKFYNKGAIPITGYALFNYNNSFDTILTSSHDATILVIKSSDLSGTYRWEIMQLNTLKEALLTNA